MEEVTNHLIMAKVEVEVLEAVQVGTEVVEPEQQVKETTEELPLIKVALIRLVEGAVLVQ
jgi:hypothetical protein